MKLVGALATAALLYALYATRGSSAAIDASLSALASEQVTREAVP